MPIIKVKKSQLLASGRLSEVDLKMAQAGAKTAKDPYVAGFTSGGARIEVGWDRERRRYYYLLSGYAADGSDCKL